MANEFEWIPCSERLPEMPKHQLDVECYLTCLENGLIHVMLWCDGWNCFMSAADKVVKENEIKDVVAWMPLPKPYKVGDGDA